MKIADVQGRLVRSLGPLEAISRSCTEGVADRTRERVMLVRWCVSDAGKRVICLGYVRIQK